MAPGDFWSGFELDPRVPAHAALRAGDDDRDSVLRLLGEAYADGRLTPGELDDRAAGVAAARHLGDLPGLVADLVPPSRVPVLPRSERAALEARVGARLAARRAGRIRLLVLVVLVSTALVVVANTSVWLPLVAGGLALVGVAGAGAGRDRAVAREVERAEWTLRDRAEREAHRVARRPRIHPTH